MNPIAWFRKRAQAPLSDESVQALRSAAAESQRSKLPQMAAALSYRTIFGIIPVIVIALLVVRHREDRTAIIHDAIEYAGLDAITIESQSTVWTEPAPPARQTKAERPAVAAQPKDKGQAMGPPAPATLEQWITGLIMRAESSVSLKAIGVVGFATLIYAAIAMLVEIERAFNQIFRVPRGRSWIRRVVNYWTLLTLGGIGLVVTFYVGAKFQVWAQDIVSGDHGWPLGSGALTVHLIGYAVTVAISTIMLTLVYSTVPNTRVNPLAALVGAFVGAGLWEAGKWGFGQYIAYSTGYARLYGSLALVPLFLLWVYYTWLIILFGLTVTFQFQHGRTKTRPQPLSDFGPTIIEPSAGLLVMTAMSRAMAIGTPQSIKALALSTGLSEPVVTLVVARFAERGLLLRVERDGETADAQYALARNPAMIRVGEVLSLGFELAGGPEANPVIERMRRAQIDAAGSETLAEIAGTPGEGRRRPPPAATAPASAPDSSQRPTDQPPHSRPDGQVSPRTATL